MTATPTDPRGPHVSDVLRVLPGPAWVFVLLALARLAWGLRETVGGPGVDAWRVAQSVVAEVPSVVSVLLPAALLVRHPDAWSRARTLLFGVVLLAVVEGLRVLGTPLQPVFERLTPAEETASFLVPAAIVYQAAVFLLGALAVVSIALGIGEARRFEDRSRSWLVSAVLALLVLLIAVAGIVSVSRLPFEQLIVTATVVAYVVSTVVLNVLSAAAAAYLASTATAGARAGEDPRRAWRVGAVGSWVVIGSLAALAALGLGQPGPDAQALFTNASQLVATVFALGYLGILGAFLLGLPAPAI